MIQVIRRFFQTRTRAPGAEGADNSDEAALRLATAVLLVQVMRADHVVTPEEHAAVRRALCDRFALEEEAADELMDLAAEEADTAISLDPFTRLLNEHLTPGERAHIVELMWHVVYADGLKDMHEEHLVRKAAKLLYVHHRDFVAARRAVERALA